MRTLPVFFALALAPLQCQVREVRTTAKDRTSLSVTIYQSGLAAIRDTRRVNLPAGPSRLAFADLMPSLRPKSATLRDPGGGLQVRERNYEFNLLSPASLVEASLGLPVRVKGENGKADQHGTLASSPLLNPRLRPDAKPLDRIARRPSAFIQPPDPNVLVVTPEGLASHAPGRLAFSQVPHHLLASPTLVQDLVTQAPESLDLTLLYTATGLAWTAHYVATLDMDGTHLDLDAFATVQNEGDQALPDTNLQLLAGDPNIVYEPPVADPSTPSTDQTQVVEVLATAVAGPPVFKEEKLSEYPVFTLDRPVTLAPRANKQLKLMSAAHVPVKQTFLLEAPYQDYGASPTTFVGSALFQLEPPTFAFSPVPQRWRTLEVEGDSLSELPPSSMQRINQEVEHDQWVACHHPPVRRMGNVPNTAASGLGRALPKGSILLRYQDPSGALVLLGGGQNQEAEFPPTPTGETIELVLGPARGFRVTRRGTFQRALPTAPIMDDQGRTCPRRQYEYGVEVRIHNSLGSETMVTVREPVTAGWEVLSSSQPGHRSGADAYDFQVRIPSRGQATLTYTARTDLEQWGPE
ncbi:MAG: hypothetical protein LWW79_10985 [Holophagaceae bacterium]|nr:hypothetical protein [Holophagaceae bacterium]